MILFVISLFSCYWEWTLLRKYIPFTSKFIYNYTHSYISWPKVLSICVLNAIWMISYFTPFIPFLLCVIISFIYYYCSSSFTPIPKCLTIVSPLQTNLQVASFQRCKCVHVFAYPTTSGVSEIAACPPSPIADDPSALLSPTSSPSPN